jgi:large subunit ribosomal protein L21
MYAVIRTGGKQQRVSEGQRVDVERLGAAQGETVSFSPVLVVDGDEVLTGTDRLDGAQVSAVVVGEAKGPKITGFTYKPKARARRRWGHRQHYSVVEITGITK